MRYDLHLHTAEYSDCSSMPAEDVCRLACGLGIDAIALTEHDRWWPRAELAALRTRHPELIIFNGMERTCREGHFLLFLPTGSETDAGEPPDTIAALSAWSRSWGGALIWAHPFRYGQKRLPPWLGRCCPDGIEVASSNMDLGMSERAIQAAVAFGLVPLTNSDAHDLDTLGRYFNEFDPEIRTVDQLIGFVHRQ
jgi:predicted metal-dependent phosphoesterase TrpH